jgi:hypothetical protein
MAAHPDPGTNTTSVPSHVPVSAPDLCGWCFGAGSLLEAMDCERDHLYLPVLCCACSGSGRRPDA